jgi:UDP-glucose 4-epimerase
MQTVMVSGANGFVGRSLVEELVSRGIYVYCLLRRHTDVPLPERSGRRYLDASDFGECRAALAGPPEIDVYFDLAWSGVGAVDRNRLALQAENIRNAVALFELACEAGIRRYVGVGSASEYACASMPIDGRGLPGPSDLYGAAKAAVHLMIHKGSTQRGVDYCRVIFPSLYGPDRMDGNVVSYAIQKLLNHEKTSFTRLEHQWEYLYVEDAVRALIAIAEQGKPGSSYPVGSVDGPRPLSYYVGVVRDTIAPGAVLGIGELPYKNATIDNCVMDDSVMRLETGYSPRIPFSEGIGRTIDSFRRRFEGATDV